MMDEEKMIDEAIDEIIGMAKEEPEDGGTVIGAACRKCGGSFWKPRGSRQRICPDCRAKSNRKKPAQESGGTVSLPETWGNTASVTDEARQEIPNASRAGRIVSEARRLRRLADAWGLTWEGLGDALNAAYLLIGMVEDKNDE